MTTTQLIRTIPRSAGLPLPRLGYLPGFRNPFSGLITAGCGLCALAGLLAPVWVEQMLPGYRTTYAPLIALVVALALLRSVWRLLSSIVSLSFFAAAAVALILTFKPHMLPNFSLPLSSPGTKILPASTAEAPPRRIEPTRVYRSLPPALPDEAYFPSRKADTTLAQGLPSVASSWLGELKNFMRR
jgi:hypothetical protein